VTITQQTLPAICAKKFPDAWSPRITRYLSKAAELKKVRENSEFIPDPGEIIQIGGFRVQRIGSLGVMSAPGYIESPQFLRVVEITQQEGGEPFPDFLGELCEDRTGPLGERASASLRERFDDLRCQFNEFGLFGENPILAGVKRRKEQRKTINEFARRLFPKDRPGAKLFADMLVDSIENLEPAIELE
jgi:hypothetical protein